MEIPNQLKGLYRHWDAHVVTSTTIGHPSDVFVNPALFDEISSFVLERIKMWERKTTRETPYTVDPVLVKYRFCNILRELDRQTIAFHTLLNPLRDDFPLWLMNMFVCRMIARTETIERVGLLTFDEEDRRAWYERLVSSPRPRYGNAYVFPVSTLKRSAFPTREKFLAEYLPGAISAVAREISTWQKMSVFDGVERVIEAFGFNHRFLWTEVLIDVAYQFPERIDLFARFPIGPGSAPTMHRINALVDPTLLVRDLSSLPLDIGLTVDGKLIHLSAENWEGIGCEFRKYTNLKAGHGRKRLYTSRLKPVNL